MKKHAGTLFRYTRKIRGTLFFAGVCAGIMAVVFNMYGLPSEPMLYGAVLCVAAGIVFFLYGYVRYLNKVKVLEQIRDSLPTGLEKIPEDSDYAEKIYKEIIWELNQQRMDAENAKSRFYGELTDYYTMWVHQIKTPIFAMKLLLQEKQRENQAELAELLKIEQYVEMVMGYLRTEDISSDMKFERYGLDGIIREQIHKYAGTFVSKKLGLEYSGVNVQVLTDKKWLGFVIGQVLSNALKYTKRGRIRIYMSESRYCTLVIEDTGIGISEQDLPRVFEKGFTGYNGREDYHSTGIGLYLCNKIMKKLGHEIYMESSQGEGTRVYLKLAQEELEIF